MKSLLAALLLAAAGSTALVADIQSPWARKPEKPDTSQGATVAQVIGANTWLQFTYHRPGVKDRDVWTAKSEGGQPIVPRKGEPGPWRAGANEATTFECSTDVQVASLDLPAGRYALFMIPPEDPRTGLWTIIFNSEPDKRVSEYDSSKDVLRIETEPEAAPFNEWLQYGFDMTEANWARAYLHWEKIKVPFGVSLKPQRG